MIRTPVPPMRDSLASLNNSCQSCGAKVLWVRTIEDEQLCLDDNPIKRYVRVEQIVGVTMVELVPTYVPHFGVCPKMHKQSGEGWAR